MTERTVLARAPSSAEDVVLRVASGLVLASLAVAADWSGPVPFAILVGLVALPMCWEWTRVVRGRLVDAALIVHAGGVALAVLALAAGRAELAFLALVLACGVVVALCRGSHAVLSGLGVLYVGLPALALVWLRNDEPNGMLAILFIYAVAWTTDTFAYVCGKLVGGPKLWPRLSPGKTWAGTLGGIGFAALAGLAFAGATAHPDPTGMAFTGILLSVATQSGDLAESALKRSFALKHASQLIPGHGGFMDRMDGIVAAAAVAAVLAVIFDPRAPAHALLFWS